MSSPTIHAIESYCQLLTLPPCLYGMYDVAKALAVLQDFCTPKVLSASNPEQFQIVLLLVSRDIIEPVVDLLWHHFARNAGSVDQMPADFPQILKELEIHLSTPMIANIWQLHQASGGANGIYKAENLLTALQRLRDFFQDVNGIMSSDGIMQASLSLEPIRFPDASDPLQASTQPTNIDPRQLKSHVSEPISSNAYSLFGGSDAWPFDHVHVDAIVDDNRQTSSASFGPSSPHHTLQVSSSFPARSSFVPNSLQNYPRRVDQLSPGSLFGETLAMPQKKNSARTVCADTQNGDKSMGSADVNVAPSQKHPFSKPNEEELASLISSLSLSTFNGLDRQPWQETPIRYKTAMCKRVADGQKCRYSKACGFAHSEAEKELYTRLHLATTRCTFGPKCHNPTCGRAHTAQEQQLAIKIYTQAVVRGRGAPLKL